MGGGAAGFFAAVNAAEQGARVVLLEKGGQFLTKVKISGGGRCNVTHACFDARTLSASYPRGGRALIGAFARFGPKEVIDWFARRGVTLKTETDGRMFPATNSSATIVDCLVHAAERAGVDLRLRSAVCSVRHGFSVILETGEHMECERVVFATGGQRGGSGHCLTELGHTLNPSVPSLFSFQVQDPLVRALPGLSVRNAEVRVRAAGLRERGPVLLTHGGLSGPAILRLSAWGARALAACGYQFELEVDWLPGVDVGAWLAQRRADSPGKQLINTPALPARLWEQLLLRAGVNGTTRWAQLGREHAHTLAEVMQCSRLRVNGKSLNKDEFVTCGGVPLSELHMKTMQSRIEPGLYVVGELCDMDAITGGFNFQFAWTSAWLAAHSLNE